VRPARWPDLEAALFEYITRAEDSITISGDLIKEKAAFLWKELPQYPTEEMPPFSNGWLYGFQTRYGVKIHNKHGEAAEVSVEDIQEQLASIQEALSAYPPQDRYNCDESGLFWKRIPSRGLTTRPIRGRKRDKTRITAHFCCNSDGSDKLPIWYIGTAKQPRAFQAAHVNINHLNCVWKHNKTAWMNQKIFAEWLRWFDNRMRGRKVALLMDNFSAHEAAVKTINSSNERLKNTLIIWLPPNATSICQPLDQGIIHSWKCHWKRQWLRYMMSEFDSGRDPQSSMNVLIALRWGIQSWDLDVSAKTVKNCFDKAFPALAIQKNAGEQGEPLEQADGSEETDVNQDIRAGLQLLEQAQYILDVMDIQNFLNPADEVVKDSLDEIDQQIVLQFTPEDEEDDDSDEIIEEIELISFDEAINALQKLRLFEEQTGGEISLVNTLNRRERGIYTRKIQYQSDSFQQQDIRMYF
jgi:hypothetical protein